MRLSNLLIVVLAFLAAAGLSLIAAGFLATTVEESSETGVRRSLDSRQLNWAEVQADGLRVVLSGTAPDEAKRFAAVSAVGEIVDAARIVDEMDVTPSRDLAPPRFSAEILRNASGISVIGLIPSTTDRTDLVERLSAIAAPASVADLMDVADYPVPRGWNDALGFTVAALKRLPRAKISVDAGHVSITAIADSPKAKAALEQELKKTTPPGLNVVLNISAPRPVITPFTLRYTIDEKGGRFDACSADDENARQRILKAAEAAGGAGGAYCTIGLGVPTPAWAEAVTQALAALAEIGGGSVTFADADVTLDAAQGTAPEVFDKILGELEAGLPDVFALHAVLPVPEGTTDSGPPEFTITLSPEGQVQLRGRLNDENLQRMAQAYAKARFGSASVYSAARTAPDLPIDWPVRVLTGIEALSRLSKGAVTVTPDRLTVSGTGNREDITAEISKLLAKRLGDSGTFKLDIAYQAPPPPKDQPITPEVCEAQIAEAQRSTGKISFEPGSATIAAESIDTMNAIADVLARCGDIRLEIQGHTDSQGRNSMNQELSQDRAQSVLNELRGRRMLTSNFTAKGYGEDLPIADNGTEEGREANRRIEFRLILPEQTDDAPSPLDKLADQPAPDADKPADTPTTATGTSSDTEGTNDE